MSPQRSVGLRLGWVVSIIACCFVEAPQIRASEAVNEHGQRELDLGDLPTPPDELQAWLARGNVTFLIGGERPSIVDPEYSTVPRRGRFDAETRYHMSYTFKSLCRWGWADTARTRRLAIQVRYEQLQLEVKHQVWLREMPDLDAFWNSRLVRHELDHVRLSSDARLNARFVAAVKQHDRVELTQEQSAPLLNTAESRRREGAAQRRTLLSRLAADDAKQWVDDVVRAEFNRTVELVEIRYRELDLRTDHGRRPVPAAGKLSEWLTPID